MTKEELEKATGQELIDERNYCGVDGYYGDYLDNVNAEMLKRFNRLAELEKRCANYEMTISKMEKDTCDICKETEKDKKIEALEQQIEKMQCWHNMDYNDKESCKKIPRGIQLLTEYDCGLFVAYCVNKWTGDHWVEHNYGITRWKEIEAK